MPDSLQSVPTESRPAAAPKRRLSSLFWPGFAAGFLLLSIFSCSGAVMATGITRLNLAELQANNVAWTPPAMTPTPVADTSVSDSTVPTDAQGAAIFHTGDQVQNITSSLVNIRRTPGYLGKPDGDIVAQARPGETVEILGGRTVADNLTWWRVRYGTPTERRLTVGSLKPRPAACRS